MSLKPRRWRVAGTMLAAVLVFSGSYASSTKPIKVQMETQHGTILLELYADKAPQTVANFLRYVDEGRYGDAAFYRTVHMENQAHNPVKIEVIQGGLGYNPHPQRLPSIPLESTQQTGVRHRDGVISMARTAAADSANSEIFICINDQPQLDHGGMRYMDGLGFAAFGRVIKGMDVVRTIQALPAREQILNDPVRILSIYRVSNQTSP